MPIEMLPSKDVEEILKDSKPTSRILEPDLCPACEGLLFVEFKDGVLVRYCQMCPTTLP